MALALIGLLQTVADMKNGVGLTKGGEIRANDQRKIQRAMQWEGDAIQIDGVPFHDPTTLLLTALRYSAWAYESDDSFQLSQTPARIAEQPYAEQIQGFLQGILQVTNWSELTEWTTSYYSRKFTQARPMLLTLLAALPMVGHEFYAVDHLDQILFDRIGPYFSLTYVRDRPYTYNKSSAEIRKIEEEWRTTLRTNWLKQERPWFEQALTTWVYFLGLVDLGFENHKLVSIRLSQLGREVLHPAHPALASTVSDETVPTEGAWIVQPNFEILVYLDHVTPAQLAFLERHAERIQSQQHVAQYRLTRESIYQGLESGTSLEDLLQQLGAGMKGDLPRNIAFEIKEWAAQREKLTLYRSTYLMEFKTSAERDSALALGLQGQPIGERFLLRSSSAAGQLPRVSITKVDYSQPLPVAFSLSEDGRIELLAGYSDLLIEAQLDQWATRSGKAQWQLNATQVQTNVKNGTSLPKLLDFLAQRAQHGLPSFLRLALQAWAGNAPALEVESVVVLHCPSAEVRQILEESSSLRPYLEGRLSSELLVVKASKLKALQELLQKCGMPALTQLTLKKLRR